MHHTLFESPKSTAAQSQKGLLTQLQAYMKWENCSMLCNVKFKCFHNFQGRTVRLNFFSMNIYIIKK